jgi:hypothetical protein
MTILLCLAFAAVVVLILATKRDPPDDPGDW